MDDTMLTIPARARANRATEAVTSLYHALQELPDPQRGQEKRYALAVILSLVILDK